MIDEIWKRDEVDSPCIKLCVLHSTERICIGCHRSAEEVRNWSRYSADQRNEIINKLEARARTLTKRRGGRRRSRSIL